NEGDEHALPALCRILCDAEPVIRGAAAWALGQIGGEPALAALKSRRSVEDNATVLSEIEQALAQCPTKSN
ncbi:MAG TPA: HEAT repeat domain-containing protein, partial [Planctomycetaceae bacterium]|nr:HEAT repeat domain-containing protein [Planctomycetaceae bacterium]